MTLMRRVPAPDGARPRRMTRVRLPLEDRARWQAWLTA